MRIIITGTPGTGKSEIAREISKKTGLRLIDIKKIALEKKLVGKNSEVDLNRLSRALGFLKNEKDYVAEGHLACEIPLPADFVFVLRTHPLVLARRLAKRKYCKKKLDGNLMAEMLDYCVQRTLAVYGKAPLEVDTSRKGARSCALHIMGAIKQKKKNLDTVDYSPQLRRHLGLVKK